MLDIRFIRESPNIIKDDLKKRNDKEKLKWVDDLITKDKEYRTLLQLNQDLRHKRNIITNEINQLRKENKDIKNKVKEAKELPNKIKEVDEKIKQLQNKIIYYLMRIPNILHKSVPKGKDETDNKEIRKWGKKPKPSFKLRAHGELIERLGLADFEQATKVAGKGFYYLIGDLALMEQALQRFAIDTLTKKGYKLVEPPLILRRGPYEGVTDLKDFETMMYKIEGEDSYLIATSEHPIAALLMNKVLMKRNYH